MTQPLLNPQIRRSRTQDLSSYTGPKSSRKWLLYFPFGKSAPTINFKKFPLILREIRLRTFTNLVVKYLVSQSPRPEKNQHLTLFLASSDFCLSRFRGLRCQATRPLDSRNPIYRNSNALASFDLSTALHSIETSDFTISRILMQRFRDFTP
jgi:hypothetical protein